MNLTQTLEDLENLRKKLSTELIPGRELYEEREWDLLKYAKELGAVETLNSLSSYLKIITAKNRKNSKSKKMS